MYNSGFHLKNSVYFRKAVILNFGCKLKSPKELLESPQLIRPYLRLIWSWDPVSSSINDSCDA